jgi:hypothetical protein
MGLVIASHTIERVAIIDDQQAARATFEDIVEDSHLRPVSQGGPLNGLAEYVNLLPTVADAALCDHHLKMSAYATFNGADLVARCNRKGFPTILCTNWDHADIDEMRCLRRYIPILVRPGNLDPESMKEGFQTCLEEYSGTFEPPRRPWRALVRVVELRDDPGQKAAYVVVPAWEPEEVVRIPASALPEGFFERTAEGARVHAQVNIGAESHGDLYFTDWEY